MSEGRSGAASGGQLEERVDLSAETDAKISQAESLIGASHDNLREALALLADPAARLEDGVVVGRVRLYVRLEDRGALDGVADEARERIARAAAFDFSL